MSASQHIFCKGPYFNSKKTTFVEPCTWAGPWTWRVLTPAEDLNLNINNLEELASDSHWEQTVLSLAG